MSLGTLVLWAQPAPDAARHPLLDNTERARCDRFRLPLDSARHATARVLAKRAAAALLDLRPPDLVVVPDSGATSGRPTLRRLDGGPLPLHLSISHAGGLVGVALSPAPCGLDVQDVEALRPLLGSDLAFTPAERTEIAQSSPDDQVALAARWWTAKEAVLKCVGRGLLEAAELLDVRTSPASVMGAGIARVIEWQALAPAAGHAAAVARPLGADAALQIVHVEDIDEPFDGQTRLSTAATS